VSASGIDVAGRHVTTKWTRAVVPPCDPHGECRVGHRDVHDLHHAAYFAAIAWALIGRAQEAVNVLREAAETGFPSYPLFAGDSNLDRIRQDPSFQAFLTDMQRQSESLRLALFDGK
jgi:hypothetical protein